MNGYDKSTFSYEKELPNKRVVAKVRLSIFVYVPVKFEAELSLYLCKRNSLGRPYYNLGNSSSVFSSFVFLFIFYLQLSMCRNKECYILCMFKYNQVLHSASYKFIYGCK